MDAGHVFSTFPSVIENIFKHLSAQDLCSAAQVCSFWHRMSVLEKKRRRDIFWFFKVLSCDFDDKLHHCSYRNYFTKVNDDLQTSLDKELSEMRSIPAFCLAFASTEFIENYNEYFPRCELPNSKKAKLNIQNRAYINSVVSSALRPHMPLNCPVTLTIGHGIIGCNKDYVPAEIEDGPALTGFVIPQVPGVEIHELDLHMKKSDLASFVAEKESVKCLLVFLSPRAAATSNINKLVQGCLLGRESRFALGGAIVERCEPPLGSVIAFSGPNVEAASVIIGPQDRAEEVRAKLAVFQETGLLENHCFAFMFACVGRGYCLYKKYNLESSVFCKMYPGVPLIGLFGNGEIGINYLPHVPTESKVLKICKFKKCLKKYLFSYTTIFVLVSIKT